jgi:hypothetical protein
MVPQIAPLARSVIDRSLHRDHAAVIPKEEAVRGGWPGRLRRKCSGAGQRALEVTDSYGEY